MAQFKAFATGVEVNGETVASVVDGMGAFTTRAKQILAECGITDVAPGKWYPQQAWLDAFHKIADSIGQKTLFLIGTKIPENAKFPPQIDAIEKALGAIDVAYHMNHRGGDIGNYGFKQTANRSATIVCRNPYPCQFDQGIIEAMAKRFKPKDTLSVTIKHDSAQPCRNNGADSCTYIVSW